MVDTPMTAYAQNSRGTAFLCPERFTEQRCAYRLAMWIEEVSELGPLVKECGSPLTTVNEEKSLQTFNRPFNLHNQQLENLQRIRSYTEAGGYLR